MAISSTPTDYANLCTGRLAEKISTTTSTGFIVTADTFTTPAGRSAATWPTGNQIWKLSRKTRTTSEVEFVGVETASQSGSTVTTGTVNRYLPANGSSLTSQGNGLSFPAGSVVELVWHAYAAEKASYKDAANTFTGVNTFGTGGAVRFSGTDTSGLRVKSLTTAERDALTAANGDLIYNTTTGVFNQYIAGAWAAIGTDATANGSTTVAGKYEEATVAEQGTATATGGTGARLVPAVANLVKASSGAGDENKIPVLGASGTLPIGMLATGTPTGSKFIRDDGTLQTPSASFYEKVVYLAGSDSTTLTNPTSMTAYDTHTYTIPADDLTATTGYKFEACGLATTGTAGAFYLSVTIGGVAFATLAPGSLGSGLSNLSFTLKGWIVGTAAAGASVAVRMAAEMIVGNNASVILSVPLYDVQNVATNGTAAIAVRAQFSASNAGNNTTLKMMKVRKISTVLFA